MVGLTAALAEHVDALELVDHHVHGPWASEGARLADALNEADLEPLRRPEDGWDTQVGFAVRRWCAPLLDLPPHVPPAAYQARRAELGEVEVTRRLTAAAGVSDWLVDTGLRAAQGTDLVAPDRLAVLSGGRTHEVTRLESVAEELIVELADPRSYADAFADHLASAGRASVGFKSVIAYRSGFDVDWAPPAAERMADAARRWQDALAADGTHPRLTDPTLLVAGVHAALRLGRPLQLHAGFGDRDLDLRRVDPLLLTDLLRRPEAAGVPVLLLHCYPYEREAGYLAQAFPDVHLDVGLAVNFLGARARSVVARSLELAPFSRVLYSSDAAGPAELHYLGARLWREATTAVLGGWVEAGDWSLDDARRVATLVGRDNARRVYGVD